MEVNCNERDQNSYKLGFRFYDNKLFFSFTLISNCNSKNSNEEDFLFQYF